MKKKQLDLSEESAWGRNAMSKFNDYEDQGGKDKKAFAARDALQKAFDEAAVEIKEKREALLAAIQKQGKKEN
jgi:hypothetical protein